MASITPTITRDRQWLKATWAGVTESDTCAAGEFLHNYSDLWIRTTGTQGGATVTVAGGFALEGDSADLDVQDMDDIDGTAIALTAVGAKPIKNKAPYMAPEISGGTGQDLTIEFWFCIVPPR